MAVLQKTAQAAEDLIDIWLYIAQDNLTAADNLLDTFEECYVFPSYRLSPVKYPKVRQGQSENIPW